MLSSNLSLFWFSVFVSRSLPAQRSLFTRRVSHHAHFCFRLHVALSFSTFVFRLLFSPVRFSHNSHSLSYSRCLLLLTLFYAFLLAVSSTLRSLRPRRCDHLGRQGRRRRQDQGDGGRRHPHDRVSGQDRLDDAAADEGAQARVNRSRLISRISGIRYINIMITYNDYVS